MHSILGPVFLTPSPLLQCQNDKKPTRQPNALLDEGFHETAALTGSWHVLISVVNMGGWVVRKNHPVSLPILPYHIIYQSQETGALGCLGEGNHSVWPTRELHGGLQKNHGGGFFFILMMISVRCPVQWKAVQL